VVLDSTVIWSRIEVPDKLLALPDEVIE